MCNKIKRNGMFAVVFKRKNVVLCLQGLVNVALDILSRIHTIPTVPIVDCFQKIRQQVKCYLQLAGVMGKNECMQVGPAPSAAAGGRFCRYSVSKRRLDRL